MFKDVLKVEMKGMKGMNKAIKSTFLFGVSDNKDKERDKESGLFHKKSSSDMTSSISFTSGLSSLASSSTSQTTMSSTNSNISPDGTPSPANSPFKDAADDDLVGGAIVKEVESEQRRRERLDSMRSALYILFGNSDPEAFNDENLKSFLLTFRLHCTPKELLSLIEEVYKNVSMKDDLNYKIKALAYVWITQPGIDDLREKAFIRQLITFLETAFTNPNDLNPLKLALIKRRGSKQKNTLSTVYNAPLGNFLLSHPDGPRLLAEQLTLAEWKLFKTLKSHDLLNTVGGKKVAHIPKSNTLNKITKRFDLISHWVAFKILTTETAEQRIQRVERFVDLARYCYELRNYQTLAQVISGLGKQSVSRLKHIKKDLSPQVLKCWMFLQQLLSPTKNFSEYRAILSQKPPGPNHPVLPFVALFQRDLAHISDGSPDKLETGALNIAKLQQLGKILSHFQSFQEHGYVGNQKFKVAASYFSLGESKNSVISSSSSSNQTTTIIIVEDEVIQLFFDKLLSRASTPAQDEEDLYDLSYIIEAPPAAVTNLLRVDDDTSEGSSSPRHHSLHSAPDSEGSDNALMKSSSVDTVHVSRDKGRITFNSARAQQRDDRLSSGQLTSRSASSAPSSSSDESEDSKAQSNSAPLLAQEPQTIDDTKRESKKERKERRKEREELSTNIDDDECTACDDDDLSISESRPRRRRHKASEELGSSPTPESARKHKEHKHKSKKASHQISQDNLDQIVKESPSTPGEGSTIDGKSSKHKKKHARRRSTTGNGIELQKTSSKSRIGAMTEAGSTVSKSQSFMEELNTPTSETSTPELNKPTNTAPDPSSIAFKEGETATTDNA